MELLFLGDSITDCDHLFDQDQLGNGYVRMIAEQLGYGYGPLSVKNLGQNGATITALHRNYKQFGADLAPNIITILVGINDIALIHNAGHSASEVLSQFRESYNQLLQEIRSAHDCPIFLMETFIFPEPAEFIHWEPHVRACNQILQELAQTHQAVFIPLWEELQTTAQYEGISVLSPDGIHLTKLGHEILKEFWLDEYYVVFSTSSQVSQSILPAESEE